VWFVCQTQAINVNKMCNSLYYGEMDKKMMNAPNHKSKYVMEDFYKRRSRQSGMSIGRVKSCYENKKKANVKVNK
jgi:hypothetical protein